MKKGFLIILAFLIVLPLINADDFSSSFSLSKSDVHLGETAILTGNINFNGKSLNQGYALIEFLDLDSIIYTTSAPISNGKFTSELTFTKKPNDDPFPSGEYSINVVINNGFGSSERYNNIKTLSVNNEISVSSSINKDLPLPGEEIKLAGTAYYKSSSERVSKANIKINFNSKEYSPILNNGDFSTTFTLPLDISSKDNEISIDIEDEYGNKGSSTLNFNVKGIQYSIKVELNKESFIPGGEIEITPLLYDQSNDLIEDEISIDITNPKKDSVYSRIVSTDGKVTYQIPDYSIPGSWKISVKSSKLETTKTIEIVEYEKLDSRIEGSILVVKNSGNMKYDKELLINAISDGTRSIIKSINLKPGEEAVFDLSKELPQGTYDLEVGNQKLSNLIIDADNRNIVKKTTDAIGLTGKAISELPQETKSTKNATYLLILVLIGIGLYGLYYYSKNYRKKSIHKEAPTTIIKNPLKVVKKKRYEFGKATDADIQEFKQRVLKDLETNSIKKNSSSQNRFDYNKPKKPPENKEQPSPFNMFD